MKLKYFIPLALAGATMLSSCKKDFLDAQPTAFTTPEQLQAAARLDTTLLPGSLNGLYTAMYTPGVGGTTGHDDFGQKGIDIYSDMLQSDMVLGALNYGWYAPVARLQATVDFTRNEDYIPWRYYYKIIFGANTIIDQLGGNDATPAKDADKATMGQAKTMRAYAYFYLSQLYIKEYGTGTDKVLPLYKSPKDFNMPKSTTKDIYDLMISDLTQAVSFLGNYRRSTKDQVDVNVARGLLSYVLASRGTQQDWAQVETLTQSIMSAYPKTTAPYVVYNGTNLSTAGFNNVSTPSWMWGVDLTLAQGIDLVSWWGQVDIFTYSYAWAGDPKVIDRGLYDQIPATDIRKAQFRSPAASSYQLTPFNKFFDPGRRTGGQRQVTTDLLYMRADEFYLLNAEAKAHLGNDAGARQVLSSYLADRITDLTYLDNLSGQALLNEIYLQTRIELWGEGKAYLALKRNKANVVRGSNHKFLAGATIPYNDPRLTFVIPQAEVLNNPNLNK
jgi:hypothetical protein